MPPKPRREDPRTPEEKAYDSAMAMLARREHGVRELETKLRAKHHDATAVESVMQRLLEDRMVNDHRYAETLVHSRRNNGYGPVRIAYELREKGVDDAIVSEYLDFSDRRWLDNLEALRNSKYGDTKPSSYADWAKRATFLTNRGFTHDQVRSILGEFG